MKRTGLSCIVAATLTAACSGGGDGIQSPTGPSSTAPPVATASPAPTPSPTPSCAPAMPANFKVDVFNTTRTFSWNPVNNATEYVILIGSMTGTSDLVSTNTTQTNYTWSGDSRGTYYARVYAKNSCGSSPTSPELVFQ